MKTIRMHDSLQDYWYDLTEPIGKNFASGFQPELTPAQMLELGVFGGHYFENEQGEEYPEEWFTSARLSCLHDPAYNYYQVDAGLSREEWEAKGWMYPDDPRGWFQWYCRYFLGRRIPAEDARQISRWRKIRRHAGQIRRYCAAGDQTCRRRQRQALLHWAYDSRKL